MVKQESIIYGLSGLIIGALIAIFSATFAVNGDRQGMMRMMGMHTDTDSQGQMHNDDMTMGDMAGSLENKTGDDFDQAFISGMIAHHQGAIDMANLAEKNAKHDEIKNLSKDIVFAQTKEIQMMQDWQKKWNYETSSSSSSHHMMGTGH